VKYSINSLLVSSHSDSIYEEYALLNRFRVWISEINSFKLEIDDGRDLLSNLWAHEGMADALINELKKVTKS
jgi:hypothetical protein